MDKVLTFALQVYIPTTYQSPSDSAELGTMWLGSIPTDLVNTLAAEIKAKQSLFYTGTDGVAAALAQRVNSGYAITSVAASSGVAGTNADGSSSGSVSTVSQQSKTRQDAIIGVVSALGAIAVLTLILVYNIIVNYRIQCVIAESWLIFLTSNKLVIP